MANNLILLGCGPTGGGGALAPDVAPVLSVTAELGSNIAELSWTPSNRTSSPGFTYDIYIDDGIAGPVYVNTTTDLTYSDSFSSGNWTFSVIPKNDVGEGPVSNDASIVLPGESEAPSMAGPSSVWVDDDILLTWNAIPGADSYLVERSVSGSGIWATLDTVVITSKLTSEPGVGTFLYRVTPFAGLFQGQTSNEVSVDVVSPILWILAAGAWDDDGIWDDLETWNDS